MSIYKEEMMTEGLGHPLFVREWLPEGDIRGLVQLCHGMAEHSARYAKLGEYLASYGYAAFCHDHRGHGKTCREGEVLGYFGETGGWDALVNDAVALGEIMRRRYPDGPYILFGHSMGSLIVSSMAALGRPTLYDAFILCGSPAPNPLAPVGKAMARGFCRIGMADKPNDILNAMAFSNNNKHFKKERSDNAWLSSDRDQVGKYDRDPLCGFHFTSAGFYDLFDGLSRVRSEGWAVKTECKPFLLISGGDDPVGNCGKGPDWIEHQLKACGREVKNIIYPGKRHEILNETDCDQVFTDIITWITERADNE